MMKRTMMVGVAVLVFFCDASAMESKHKRVASESAVMLAKSLQKELVLVEEEEEKPVAPGLLKLSGMQNGELLQEALFNSGRKDERLLQLALSRLLLGQAIQEDVAQGKTQKLERNICEYDDLAEQIKKNV